MKGHFHLAQISSTQIYKFVIEVKKNTQPCLMFAYLENESRYVRYINIKNSPHKVSKYPKYLYW